MALNICFLNLIRHQHPPEPFVRLDLTSERLQATLFQGCCVFCLFVVFAVVIGLYGNTVCVWNQTQIIVFYVSQDSMPNLGYSGQTESLLRNRY